MTDYATWFLGSMVVGAWAVWLARSFALRRGWLDYPNERSSHVEPTPRIGGVGMFVPVTCGVVVLTFLANRAGTMLVLTLLAPSVLVAGLSLVDDRFDLSRGIRFAGHALSAVLALLLFAAVWRAGPYPLVGTLLPGVLVGAVLFIWISGLINAYNFMDGIDGMAAVQGLVALGGWTTIFLFGIGLESPLAQPLAIFTLVVAGSLAGFLVLNWAPAKIFLGDVGSTFLGCLLAVLPFGAAAAGLPLDRALEAGFLMVWPFVLDSGTTFVRRLIRREPVFEPHRIHIYQVLAASFASRESGHRRTSLLYGLLAVLGIVLYWTSGPLWAKLVVVAWVWVAVGFWTLGLRRASDGKSISSGGKLKTPVSPRPGMSFEIFLSPPEISVAEYQRVNEALSSGFIAPVGPQLDAFEAGLARYLGVDEIQAVSSGTAALHLGLRGLGVGPGDCVLCPDLTFIASVNPVRYLGAEPVLVDVDPGTWAMDTELAREAVRRLRSEGRIIRAMVVVHAFGIPAPMEELVRLAREEKIGLLEDCAGAFGTRVGNGFAGTFGDAAAFSFNGNKVLTTSGGGALFLKDPQRRVLARSWANQGKNPGDHGYVHDTLGYNYKLSNISAAIGLAQLETVAARLERKAWIFRTYKELLSGLEGISFLPEPPHGRGNYWLTSIGAGSAERAASLVSGLREAGVEAAPMWRPMHCQKVNSGLSCFGGGESERISTTHLSLPSGSGITRQQIERICRVIREKL